MEGGHQRLVEHVNGVLVNQRPMDGEPPPQEPQETAAASPLVMSPAYTGQGQGQYRVTCACISPRPIPARPQLTRRGGMLCACMRILRWCSSAWVRARCLMNVAQSPTTRPHLFVGELLVESLWW